MTEERFTMAELMEQKSMMDKQDKLIRYEHLNKMARKGQILFCGSSLMEQFPIAELLMDAGEELTVYNRGIGGFTTYEMEEALDTVVFGLEPSHIFLSIGTNDLNEEDYRLDQLIANYERILTEIRGRLSEAKLYLIAYYPMNPQVLRRSPILWEIFHRRTNERVAEANEALGQMAERAGAQLLDYNNVLTDEEGCLKEEYTVDGIHMYADGYAQIFREMLPLLRSLT